MRYIGIIILLVFCLTLLLLTGCIVNIVIAKTVIENIENQENAEEPVMWSGLGMVLFSTSDNVEKLSSFFSDQIDDLLANGFNEIRTDAIVPTNAEALAISKSAVAIAVAKGANVIWGVNCYAPVTASDWVTHRVAVLAAAQWAQDNGVYEFIIGNEEEYKIDGTTLTLEQLIINLKSLATEVKAIFTNGNVTYSFAIGGNWENYWIAAGKGDIDFLGMNVYMNGDGGGYSENWKTYLTNMVNAFGVDGTYITEFSPSGGTPLENYSEDEVVQAAAVTEMIDYIKASGIERALFFTYYDDPQPFCIAGFGALKTDGTYRLLWNQALLNSDSVKSITVPTKTATISLPDTIALLAKLPG